MSGRRPRAAAGSPWAAIVAVVGAGVISAGQVGKAAAALPAVRADLGLDLATASWLLSAFAVVGAVAGLAVGLVVDRARARCMVLVGLLLQGIAGAAGSLSGDAPLLLASRALEGTGFLAVIVAAPAVIVGAAKAHDLGRAMALWGTFMPVGLTLSLLAAPSLPTLGWRGFWLLNAGVLLCYAALLALATRSLPSGVAASRSLTGDAAATLARRGPWLLAGLFAAFAATFFAVFGFLPQLLAWRLGVGPEAGSFLSGLAMAVNALGNLLCGALLARGVLHRAVLLGGFAAMALCSFGILAGDAPAAAYACCLLFSVGAGLIPVALLDAAGRHAPRPDLVGATIGLMMQGNNAGLVLGPAAAGAVAAAAGWPAVAWLVAALAATAALLVLALPAGRAGSAVTA